eukprot:gb/GECG01013157.1/.p1 GENE.gb/GECG01013157.1/~~gb/GECG01013157.1/.p1  ORF type:complete len:224 (+),score=6.91 gb/GECG01013157.1/:1-672(+)
MIVPNCPCMRHPIILSCGMISRLVPRALPGKYMYHRLMSTLAADRPVLTLTAHFRVPEQGMEEYEPLSRSSAFIVGSDLEQSPADNLAEDGTPAFGAFNKLHFLTSQHVTHPFRFPQYYPPEQGYEFIQFISEEHMKYTVELRDANDGNIVFQFPLSDNPHYTFRHPVQDVTCLHVDNDFLFSESLQQHDCNCDVLELGPIGTRGNRVRGCFILTYRVVCVLY